MLEDSNTVLNDLCLRMSLRAPQKESLERLAASVEAAGIPSFEKLNPEGVEKQADPAKLQGQLAAVRGLYSDTGFAPEGEAFDWDFLSFCFALATGVGKTRLMGAIIAYLYRVKGVRNFLVIAPGKTVYEKLIADFSEGTPKYVFKGLSCFATQKPVIVTGETYQNGAGTMKEGSVLGHSIAINIFNIQKLNERGDSHDEEQKSIAKIRRLRETLGQSYFDYLKSREDLVVLMDEAHHYRASEGAKTIGELMPLLGVEMTATPRVSGARGQSKRFGDVLLEYGLAAAMKDGFVKEPAVVRRQNYRPDDWQGRDDDLDRMKLEDAITVHEATKAAIADYASKNGVEQVKPFVLVVAPDTEYADKVEKWLKSPEFCGGKYAGKTITITSARSGDKNDDAVAKLLSIEEKLNPVEIVIHVNMLTEGWDVTNLYTIVPLRAANSETLVEQTIGRGLRLPYGKRTGVTEIDTLSIVSHDKFEAIIEAAKKLGFAMKSRVVPKTKKTVVTVAPKVLAVSAPVGGGAATGSTGGGAETENDAGGTETGSGGEGGALEKTKRTAFNVIGALVSKTDAGKGLVLTKTEVKNNIVEEVAKQLAESGSETTPEMVEQGVKEALRIVGESMIRIPQVTISPGATTMRVEEFKLDTDKINYALRDDRLVYEYVMGRRVMDVQVQKREEKASGESQKGFVVQLVNCVAQFGDIDYEGNRDLIGGLCEECVKYLASKLNADDLANCQRTNLRVLAEGIRQQIMGHTKLESGPDIVTVVPGPLVLKANTVLYDADEKPRPYGDPLQAGEKSRIRSMVFTGFRKCLFSLQKFDSDPERVFAGILEREECVQKWFKPTLSNLQLRYGPKEYTPDFVVETDTERLLCEVKATDEVNETVVQEKKDAAVKWCQHANKAEAASGAAKLWRYLLVPDNAINGSLTLAQAVADFGGK